MLRERRDIKISKEQYRANEPPKFTGKALEWHENIKATYEKHKMDTQIKYGENPEKLLEELNVWLFKSTYKLYKIGPDGWSPETVVLAAYQRALYKLQVRLRGEKSKTEEKCGKLTKKMITR